MRRRYFLGLPLVAGALVAEAGAKRNENPGKGFKVERNKGRGIQGLKVLGNTFDCKVSGEDTDGQLCIFDTTRDGQGGPPLHLHHEQDEWFYVIKGEFKVQVGDEQFLLKEGDSAFAPRKIPHSFVKISEGMAQMMVMFQPAGQMESFFKERSALDTETDPVKKEARLKSLWDRYGMQVVGPPMKI
jgi:mannose-6-phosphate isomerase-like protein (cupin superfamily)